MKILLSSLILLLFIPDNIAQSAAGYLSRLPALPANTCAMTIEQKERYLLELDELHEELSGVIKEMLAQAEQNTAGIEEEYKKKLTREYGLTQSEMKKLEDEESLSEQEKRVLINKMLQNKANMSLDEVENLEKMSDPDRKAWAEAYAAEQLALSRTNPDATKKETREKEEQYELISEQKFLFDKIGAEDKKMSDQLAELGKEEIEARKALKARLEPLQKKLIAEEGDQDDILKKIHILEEAFCNEFTPKFFMILRERIPVITSLMPDYERLEIVINQVNRNTLGTDKEFMPKGIIGLQAVESFIYQMQDVFQYAVYTTE
jgi:tRNA(Ser,Leu) C12 N-acetylase TAN1